MDNTHHNALKLDKVLDGKYELNKVLGSGGFGITYLAEFKKLNSKVVIKEYFPNDLAHRDANSTIVPFNSDASDFYFKGKERFLFEAQTIAKFKHPYIVRIIDYFEENNTAYFVMDYEEGEDLGDWLKKQKNITEEDILPIIVPILDALSEIHAQNIYHRDIKPDNIYMRTNGAPMLIDFGAAKESNQVGSQASSMNAQTAGYAAPEQKSSIAKYIGPYTDLYALGSVLHKMVTGKTPPTADDRSISRDNEGFDCYVPLADKGVKGFSESFLKNIDWALQFLAKDRPQTAKELQSALMAKEIKVVKEDIPQLKEEKPEVVKPQEKKKEPKQQISSIKETINNEVKDKKKNGVISVAVAILLLLLLAGIVVYKVNQSSSEQEAKVLALQKELKEKERKATLAAQELLDKRKEEETSLALERQKEREQKEKAQIEERVALEKQQAEAKKAKEKRVALEKQQTEAKKAEEKRISLEKVEQVRKDLNKVTESNTNILPHNGMTLKRPEAPYLSNAIIVNKKVKLIWEARDNIAKSYILEKIKKGWFQSDSTEEFVDIKGNLFIDEDVLLGTNYQYKVFAVDQNNIKSLPSNTIKVILK